MKIMTFQRLPKISEDMLDKATYLGKATTLIWPRQIKGFSPFVSRQNSRVAMCHNVNIKIFSIHEEPAVSTKNLQRDKKSKNRGIF